MRGLIRSHGEGASRDCLPNCAATRRSRGAIVGRLSLSTTPRRTSLLCVGRCWLHAHSRPVAALSLPMAMLLKAGAACVSRSWRRDRRPWQRSRPEFRPPIRVPSAPRRWPLPTRTPRCRGWFSKRSEYGLAIDKESAAVERASKCSSKELLGADSRPVGHHQQDHQLQQQGALHNGAPWRPPETENIIGRRLVPRPRRLLVRQCLLLALSGHPTRTYKCPLSGVKRT